MCASAAKSGRKCIRVESSSLAIVVARVALQVEVATIGDHLVTLLQTVGTLHLTVGTPQVTKLLLAHIPLQFQPIRRQYRPTLRLFQLTLRQFQLTQHLHQPIKRQLLLTQRQILGTRLPTREPIKSRTLLITKSRLQVLLRKPSFKNLRHTLQTLTART